MLPKEEKGKLLLTLSPRESEVLGEFEDLAEQGKLPNNKTEVFRRGLHIARRLVDVDEKPLERLLAEKLESCAINLNKGDIETIVALSSTIHSILIAKRGILGAEIFESIPLTCSYLPLYERKDVDRNEVRQTMRSLATAIRTIFLAEPRGVPPKSAKQRRSTLPGKVTH